MKAVLFALALLPATAFAMSGHEYLSYCQGKSVYDRAQCMGYLDALLDRGASGESQHAPAAVGLRDVALSMRADDYCLPVGTRLPLLRDVVVRRLEGMPAPRLAGDAGALIRGVLRRTYPLPCAP